MAAPYIVDPLGAQVYARLKHQSFPTRREALQAVGIALVLIEAEERGFSPDAD